MIQAHGYIRVSTNKQDESLETQETAIRNYCKFKNIHLIDIFIDNNISGFTEINKRPAGSKLKNVNNIIVTKPDRLFRNVKDAISTTEEWNSQNINLHIVDMGGISLTTNTAIGKLMFTTIIAFSEFERNITGERTKAILKNKKETNKTYCRLLFGYDNINGKLTPNKSELETISTIKNLSTKFKPTRIARILNNTGHRTKTNKRFHQSTINYIIKNPIYT